MSYSLNLNNPLNKTTLFYLLHLHLPSSYIKNISLSSLLCSDKISHAIYGNLLL